MSVIDGDKPDHDDDSVLMTSRLRRAWRTSARVNNQQALKGLFCLVSRGFTLLLKLCYDKLAIICHRPLMNGRYERIDLQAEDSPTSLGRSLRRRSPARKNRLKWLRKS